MTSLLHRATHTLSKTNYKSLINNRINHLLSTSSTSSHCTYKILFRSFATINPNKAVVDSNIAELAKKPIKEKKQNYFYYPQRTHNPTPNNTTETLLTAKKTFTATKNSKQIFKNKKMMKNCFLQKNTSNFTIYHV